MTRATSIRRRSRLTWRAAYYYLDKYGKDLHGVYVFGNDSKSARDASFASLGGLRDIGA